MIVAVATAILTGALTHHWTRKTKIDEVRIAKIHELVLGLAVSFQSVHEKNEHLAHWFRTNFSAMNSVHAGVQRFREQAAGLYASDAATVEQLTRDKQALADLLKQARIYLPQGLCDDLAAYLATCAFGWSNVWPLFDTYVEGLFDNLLDEKKAMERTKLAARILKALKKAGA